MAVPWLSQALAPLVAVYDVNGALVGSVVGWDATSAEQVEHLLESKGQGSTLDKTLAVVGVERSKKGTPTILTISLGQVCEPCSDMEKEISNQDDEVNIVQLSVNTQNRQ